MRGQKRITLDKLSFYALGANPWVMNADFNQTSALGIAEQTADGRARETQFTRDAVCGEALVIVQLGDLNRERDLLIGFIVGWGAGGLSFRHEQC